MSYHVRGCLFRGDPATCPGCGKPPEPPPEVPACSGVACEAMGHSPDCPPEVPARPHLTDGEFQSDKYPTTPRGKVPLSVKDPTAQDLLWEYAQRRRSVDAEFSADLEAAVRNAGYVPEAPAPGDSAIPEDDDIGAAHPTRTGRHDLYAEAMRMVGAKQSKQALVDLVNWLLSPHSSGA
ncbi:MAG TPA: hypothetical protein VK550_17775, partial [Polyangiaceae bacterium]|nr:hypothetical protein [Polyangiaceae bacterium]